MKTINSLTSACRYCQYYKLEGRRGGTCQLLGAPVQGGWKACALALPPFAPSWEGLEEVMIWQEKTPDLSLQPVVADQLDNLEVTLVEQVASARRERIAAESMVA